MKKILCFFVFLSIVLAFYWYNKDNFGKIYNGNEWDNYRLGDVYHLSKKHKLYSLLDKENVLYHKTKFPGSIANEYINKNEMDQKNYNLLKKIIDSKTIDRSEHPDTLFLHIRVGDVLCEKNEWLDTVNGPKSYSKVGDTDWWNNILTYIHINNIKRVVIISGSHKMSCLKESKNYIKDRKKFLTDNNLTVDLRLGQSPDEDLIMCFYVKHFISTGGGYGNLIKELKKNNM